MTYADAKARLLTMITSLSPARDARGVQGDFMHVVDGDLVRSRQFSLLPTRATTIAPRSHGREVTDMRLEVVYEVGRNQDELLDSIRADRTMLAQRLLDETQWDRPTSTIVQVASGSAVGDLVAPSTIEGPDDDGHYLLGIDFSMEHRT